MDEHLGGCLHTMARIRRVFVESLNLSVRDDQVPYEQMLEEIAILDSIALLEFVAAVEKEFGIQMEPELLDFDFLRDLPALASHIEHRIEGAGA
jgi:acyl carrier protein